MRLLILIFCFAIAANISAQKNIGKTVLQAEELLPYSSTDLVNNKLELISSTVHFGFSFEGSECEMYAPVPAWTDHNYLQYELNGVCQKE